MMDLLTTLFITSIIGGLVAVDTAACLQIMISQPIVSCTVIGLIMGQPEIGMFAGMLLQLPWLINIPSGGTHDSEINIGAVVASSLSVFFFSQNLNTNNIVLIVAIIYSLIIGRVGAYLVEFLRKVNVILAHKADTAARNGNLKKIELHNLTGIFFMFSMGFVLSASGFVAGFIILKPLIQYINPELNHAFQMAKYGILGLGFGSAAALFISEETKWFPVAGAGGAILILILFYI